MNYIVKLQDDHYNRLEFAFSTGGEAVDFMQTCTARTRENLTATLEIRSEVKEVDEDEEEE